MENLITKLLVALLAVYLLYQVHKIYQKKSNRHNTPPKAPKQAIKLTNDNGVEINIIPVYIQLENNHYLQPCSYQSLENEVCANQFPFIWDLEMPSPDANNQDKIVGLFSYISTEAEYRERATPVQANTVMPDKEYNGDDYLSRRYLLSHQCDKLRTFSQQEVGSWGTKRTPCEPETVYGPNGYYTTCKRGSFQVIPYTTTLNEYKLKRWFFWTPGCSPSDPVKIWNYKCVQDIYHGWVSWNDTSARSEVVQNEAQAKRFKITAVYQNANAQDCSFQRDTFDMIDTNHDCVISEDEAKATGGSSDFTDDISKYEWNKACWY